MLGVSRTASAKDQSKRGEKTCRRDRLCAPRPPYQQSCHQSQTQGDVLVLLTLNVKLGLAEVALFSALASRDFVHAQVLICSKLDVDRSEEIPGFSRVAIDHDDSTRRHAALTVLMLDQIDVAARLAWILLCGSNDILRDSSNDSVSSARAEELAKDAATT
jgi:hypothetical protein